MKAAYTSRALAELQSAYSWYEQRQEGLGDAFLDELDAAIERIEANPNQYPRVRSAFRRCLTKRFPFSLIFTAEREQIVIHAVFDTRRDLDKLP